MPSKWVIKARLALDQDPALLFRRGLLIHLVKRTAAIEIFSFARTHLMPFAQCLEHRGRRLARHSGCLVFRAQTSHQGLAFRIGVQLDELAREHVLLEVDALRVPYPFNVLVFAASPCVARTCLAKLGKERLTGRAVADLVGLSEKGGGRQVRRWISEESHIPYAACAILCEVAGLGKIWEVRE
jgi:hypothetical protein